MQLKEIERIWTNLKFVKSQIKKKTLILGFNLNNALFDHYLASSLTILTDRVGIFK